MGEGYYFTPLSSLSKKKSQFKYFRASPQYATVDGEKDVVLPILSIDEFVVENDHNIIDAMNQGRYLSSLNYYDMITRNYGVNTYSINREFNDVRHLEENYPANRRMINEFSSIASSILYIPNNTGRIDDTPDYNKDVHLRRNAQLSQFNSHGVRISVPGNSDIHAGDVIEIEVPNKDAPRNEVKSLDKSVSGRYIVRSVRHQVSKNTEYTSFLTLSRDSILQPYPENQTIANLESEETYAGES